MDHDLFDDQYDDHLVDEHDYYHAIEDDEGPEHEADHYHDAAGHGSLGGGEGEDNENHDPDVHGDAQTLDFVPTNDGLEYEPHSPSYPYPEDQQPPESEIASGHLGEDGDQTEEQRNPRHISEIYARDAVSGAELGHDSSIIAEYMKSKDPDWDNVTRRTEPLNLLELPVDVLRLIVKEVCTVRAIFLVLCGRPLYLARWCCWLARLMKM